MAKLYMLKTLHLLNISCEILKFTSLQTLYNSS